MSNHIENNRNGCLLQGTISILKAIKGVVPIVHSTAGCGVPEKFLANTTSRENENYTTASTNVFEKQVIFGGTARLREQIKNTVKVLEGDFYVVVSGCATEIVGDDMGAMTKEAYDQGYPIMYLSTPGFKGKSFHAYEKVITGIVEELADNGENAEETALVNVFGLVPGLDPFWEGNLEELDALLKKAGLQLNRLFGRGSSIDNWKRINAAQVNIAYTKYGLEIVRYLKDKFGTPYLYFENLPVGADGVTELLDKLEGIYEDKKELFDRVRKEEQERFLYYLSKLAPYYYRHHIQKEAVLVGAAPIVTALGRFLEQKFGQIIQAVIVTDEQGEGQEELLKSYFTKGTRIYYTEDGGEIEGRIKEEQPEVILGSQLEEKVARELNVPLLHSSLPSEKEIILGRSIFGVSGGLSFLEEYSNLVIH